MEGVIKVLIVDDSAYVRKVFRQMLMSSPFIEVVGAARDGQEALELVEQLNPDVVTLDMIMPRMDGLAFIKEQMARKPLPIVVVSIASESGELALQALDEGAVDFIQKPTALATDKVFSISAELIEKVKTAATISPANLRVLPTLAAPAQLQMPTSSGGSFDILVLGISTGGPQALKYLIPQLPADFPLPIAMVLHMPVGYTEAYAQKLDELSPMKISEAREGDVLQPGSALLAPAGRHLSFLRLANGTVITHLDARPFDTQHRPAVDVLFTSAANVYGGRVLGVVMTGMGTDGTNGAAWIKSQGGVVFTEAEESCVVYGMPRSVVEAGLSDNSFPLSAMAQAIMEVL